MPFKETCCVEERVRMLSDYETGNWSMSTGAPFRVIDEAFHRAHETCPSRCVRVLARPVAVLFTRAIRDSQVITRGRRLPSGKVITHERSSGLGSSCFSTVLHSQLK